MYNLTQYLYLNQIEISDFFVLLQEHPSSCQFVTKQGETQIRISENSKHKFSIYLNKRGKFLRSEIGPDKDDDELKRLRESIEKNLLPASEVSTKIHKSFIFSSKHLSGPIVCDYFTLLPPPQTAPQLPSNLLGIHPIIIELPIKITQSSWLNGQRTQKKLKEYVLLLNLLFNAKIILLTSQDRGTYFYWVNTKKGDSVHIEYCQEIYTHEGFPTTSENFTNLTEDVVQSETPIASDYYDPRKSFSSHLNPPPELNEYIQKFEGLNANDQLSFLKALQWFYKIHFVAPVSDSLAFLCLANAIQLLAEENEISKNDANKSWIESLVNFIRGNKKEKGHRIKFREFLQFYVKDIDKKNINDFYGEYRSKIAHGALLKSDYLGGIKSIFDPSSSKDSIILENYKYIVRLALLGWLNEK